MTYRDTPIDDKFMERLRIEADKQGIDELILVTRGKGFGIGVVQLIK